MPSQLNCNGNFAPLLISILLVLAFGGSSVLEEMANDNRRQQQVVIRSHHFYSHSYRFIISPEKFVYKDSTLSGRSHRRNNKRFFMIANVFAHFLFFFLFFLVKNKSQRTFMAQSKNEREGKRRRLVEDWKRIIMWMYQERFKSFTGTWWLVGFHPVDGFFSPLHLTSYKNSANSTNSTNSRNISLQWWTMIHKYFN